MLPGLKAYALLLSKTSHESGLSVSAWVDGYSLYKADKEAPMEVGLSTPEALMSAPGSGKGGSQEMQRECCGNEGLDYRVANREKPYFILGRYV
ncbi:hypothetical protein NDU88_002072 [Pleurodeles waltl]|uniref:Uncharacterized protein n=1 Tax=Pleurodeles waltl TaxID=8319 RepID=A0AAV7T1I0_PLEWA|nr:hypothetical protein NDU88_002072 [Pleurodeles waltl]